MVARAQLYRSWDEESAQCHASLGRLGGRARSFWRWGGMGWGVGAKGTFLLSGKLFCAILAGLGFTAVAFFSMFIVRRLSNCLPCEKVEFSWV